MQFEYTEVARSFVEAVVAAAAAAPDYNCTSVSSELDYTNSSLVATDSKKQLSSKKIKDLIKKLLPPDWNVDSGCTSAPDWEEVL